MRIHKICLKDDKIFGDAQFQLFDFNDESKEPYTTILIGPNGSGKSFFLSYVVKIFERIYKQTNYKFYYKFGIPQFSINYEIDGNNYSVGETDITLENSKIADDSISYHRVLLPKARTNSKFYLPSPRSILSVSNIINDRFPLEDKNFEPYSYIGIRATNNTARTTTFVKRTIDNLYRAVDNTEFQKGLIEILDFLGFDKSLRVFYHPRYKNHIFSGSLNESVFRDFFDSYWKYTKRSKNNPPWSLSFFNKIKSDNKKISKLTTLCNKISQNMQRYQNSRTQYYSVELTDKKLNKNELVLISELHRLDLLSSPEMRFKKNNLTLETSQLSSGELVFATTMISIYSRLKKNSIVLIDEPENSLHPEWQSKFVTALKKVFKSYSSTHFIISTHSPLMISDLEGSSSTIVSLKLDNIKGKSKIRVDHVKQNTFGWPIEEILIDVFGTVSSRNYYLSERLSEIFKLISKAPSEEVVSEIKSKVAALKNINLSLVAEDPLNPLIKKLISTFG